MSSSVKRNSIIMAVGTAASKVTGQLRGILCALAIGTTGIAANAYQTGSAIPQILFNVLAGGVFNAVLVPQIIKALKREDAQDRLNRLITLSVTLLLSVTLIMTACTHLLTTIYVNDSWTDEQRALADAFTLWCTPQIFFYGLYAILGQILAAKGQFGAYAWSSVGANVISCAGFFIFLKLFGNAKTQPLSFWTGDKIALTAGAWTLGVAFQALVLFIPLICSGFKFRFNFGLRDSGLKSVGTVAAWSIGIVITDNIATIFVNQVTTGAPQRGGDLLNIAGNGSFQYAQTIYMLPYCLIAVSITTATFPRLSHFVANNDISAARAQLSESLRHTGLIMIFFAAMLIALPNEIASVLTPGVSQNEISLMTAPLMTMSLGLPAASIVLLIKRAFFAFEDGKSPFITETFQYIVQSILIFIFIKIFPPKIWTSMVGMAVALGFLLSMPMLFVLARKRFNGLLDGKRICLTYTKAALAAGTAFLAGKAISSRILKPGSGMTINIGTAEQTAGTAAGDVKVSWISAFISCLILSLVMGAIYIVSLLVMRTEELNSILNIVLVRLGRKTVSQEDASQTVIDSETGMSRAQTEGEIYSRAVRTVRGTAKINNFVPDMTMALPFVDTVPSTANPYSSTDVPAAGIYSRSYDGNFDVFGRLPSKSGLSRGDGGPKIPWDEAVSGKKHEDAKPRNSELRNSGLRNSKSAAAKSALSNLRTEIPYSEKSEHQQQQHRPQQKTNRRQSKPRTVRSVRSGSKTFDKTSARTASNSDHINKEQ